MNPITQHNPISAQTAGRGRQTRSRPPHRRWHLTQHVPPTAVGAGILAMAAVAAMLVASAPPASATPPPGSPRGVADPPSATVPAAGRLNATFTTSPASVTPKLGMVELLLTGTGTVQGFGSATEVVGVIQDFAVSPCGAGGASDSAQRRMVLSGGVLVLHEAGMTCPTASGPQASATYRVDGQASTGIFAGASGTGHVTVDVATHHETLSGTLILIPPPA